MDRSLTLTWNSAESPPILRSNLNAPEWTTQQVVDHALGLEVSTNPSASM